MMKKQSLVKRVLFCLTVAALVIGTTSTVIFAEDIDDFQEETEVILERSSTGIITDTSGKWKSWEGRWWYEYPDGSCVKSSWLLIGNKYYYFDEEGWMVTGWYDLDGYRYY